MAKLAVPEEPNKLWSIINSNAVGMPVGAIGTIIIGVMGMMRTDIRFLLYTALPFMALLVRALVSLISDRVLRIISFVVGCALSTFGIWRLDNYLEPRRLKDLAEFGKEIVLATADNSQQNKITGTAFWIRRPIYIVACSDAVGGAKSVVLLHSLSVALDDKDPNLNISFISSTSVGLGEVSHASYEGLTLLLPPIDPDFISMEPQTVHGKPKYFTQSPEVATVKPSEGDKVYMSSVEPGEAKSKTGPFVDAFNVQFNEGKIIGVNAQPNAATRGFPILTLTTTLPFVTSYCGAPVFDENKKLLGVMLKEGFKGSSLVIAYDSVNTLIQ
jgi:hypothetical protein